MSLTSLMLAFLPAFIQPKRERDKTAREAELERRVEELEGEIDRLLRLNERAAGRIRELEAFAVAPPGAFVRIEEFELARRHGAQMAAQQNMANPLAHAQMLQVMNQQLAAWGHCNCVPARHDMLLGAIGGV